MKKYNSQEKGENESTSEKLKKDFTSTQEGTWIENTTKRGDTMAL